MLENEHAALRGARLRGWGEIIEREREFDAVRSLLEMAREGSGSALVVRGRAGMGKSALLGLARDLAGAARLPVLRGRGIQGERDHPFGVVRQLLEPSVLGGDGGTRAELFTGAAALAQSVFPQPAGNDDDRELPSLLHGLFWLLCNVASQPGGHEMQPVVLLVDDVHWSDAPSLAFLQYLVERLDQLPFALVLAVRNEEGADAAVTQLVRHPRAQPIELPALSDAGVAHLVRSAYLPTASAELCTACARVSAGNPFVLRALLTELSEGAAWAGPASAERVSQLVPEAVLHSVIARIARLPEAAARLAEAVAVLGDGTPLHRAAALAGMAPLEASAMVDRLAAEDVLGGDDGLRFVHPLVRSAMYDEIPTTRLRRLYGEAARLLSAQGAPLDSVASHLLAGDASGDPWAVEVLREAARTALQRGSPDIAARQLRRALEEPPPPHLIGEVTAELGHAESLAGVATALETLQRSIRLLPAGMRRAMARRDLARSLNAVGRHVEAVEAFDLGLHDLDTPGHPLHEELSVGRFMSSTLVGGMDAAEVMAPVPRDPLTQVDRILLAQMAVQAAAGGGPAAEVLPLADISWSGGALLERETADGSAWSLVTAAYYMCGQFESVRRVIDAVVEDARRRGSPMGFATASYIRSAVDAETGHIADAVADAQQALDMVRYGWQMYTANATAYLVAVLLEREEVDSATAALDTLDPDLPAHGLQGLWVLLARGRLQLSRGLPEGAVADLRLAAREADAYGVLHPGWLPWRAFAIVAHLLLGEKGPAAELADAEWEACERVGVQGLRGRALRLRGLVAGGAQGLELLHEAMAQLADSEYALERTRARVDLGAALRRAGHLRDARHQLGVARQEAEAMGSLLLARHAVEELLAAGGRPRRSAVTGPRALTPRELRVAEMAATGMSNAQIAQALFVTIKAVEGHLGNAFAKLQIRTRRDLGRALGASSGGG